MKQARSIAAAIVATSLTAASALQAQNEPLKRPDVIPIDLATALATASGFTGGGEPQILVGTIPEWIQPKLHIPAGARVLGSAFLGTTVVGVINIPTWSDSVVKDIERAFQRLGWKPLPAMGGPSGGFRPTPAPTATIPQTFSLCQENQMLTVRTTRQGTSTNVMMRVSGTGSGFSPCTPRQFPSQPDRQPLPTLYDPAGASDRMECYQNVGGSGGYATGTRLRTSMTPDAVLEHYGRQLSDSGWMVMPGVGTTVERRWSRRDSAGRNSEVTLTVTSSFRTGACLEVSLNLSAPRDR